MKRIRLSTGRVAWWAFVPLRWRLFWTISPYVPVPWSLTIRAIAAEVDANQRWRASLTEQERWDLEHSRERW